MTRAALLTVLLASFPANGVPAQQPIAIINARVHPVSGPVIENGALVFEGDRILQVGAAGDVSLPRTARVIDASGKVVTPGFLDSYTQLGVTEIDLVENTTDFRTEDDEITAAFNVADGLNPFSTAIPVTRVEGVTRAVVAPQTGSSVVAGQGILIDLSGRLGASPADLGIEKNPVAMFAALGEAGAELVGGARGAAVLRLREALQDAEDYAINREAFESNRRREYAVSRLDLEALVPVVEGRLPLAVTVNRASDILAVLRVGREFGLRLVLLGAAEGWMVASQIAEAGWPVVLNPLANIPSFESLGISLENAARLDRAGVDIALASFETHNSRKLKQAAGNAVAHGLPHEAALRAVTLGPARIWGIADGYGSLEPGKQADVVIWSGDPFELTTRVERVFIRGREIPLRTRQTELLDHYRTLPPAPPAAAARRPTPATPAEGDEAPAPQAPPPPPAGGIPPTQTPDPNEGPVPLAPPAPAEPAPSGQEEAPGAPIPPGEGPQPEPAPPATSGR